MSADTERRQVSTFYLGDRLYGIDVMEVQEVTQSLPITGIRLAPPYVKGLINLRGQISTAISLGELFELGLSSEQSQKMAVVCNNDGHLLSLLVDRIGDVIEVDAESYEPPPETLSGAVKKFMQGVYKTKGEILSVIGVENIAKALNQKNER